MHRFFPYILKSIWGHRTRTLLTVTGSAVALFVFCIVTSVGEGLDRLTEDTLTERTLIMFQTNRFCPATSSLPEDYATQVRKLPGVVDAIPIKVYTNNCRASLDVVVFHGVPADKLQSARSLKLASGDWATFERLDDGAMIGRSVARRRGVTTGDRFSIGGLTVTVAGVFSAPKPSEEDLIYTHLAFLQRMRGKQNVGRVTQHEVLLTEQADSQTVAAQIDDLFRDGPVATDTRTKGVFQAASVSDLAELIGFAHYLGVACVGLVLMLVATTTVMAVQDRIREHGVLRTIGVSDRQVYAMVLIESLIVSTVGGVLGVGLALGTLAANPISLGAEAVTIAFEPSLSVALYGLAAAALSGLVAGLIPAWQASRCEIVAALRHV